MKNIVKTLAFVIASASLMVACNNNKAAEELVEDTMPIEEIVEDTVEEVADAIVEEEPVQQVTKKTTKKEEVKPVATGKESNVTLGNVTAHAKDKVKKEEATTNTKEENNLQLGDVRAKKR
ncbi:MAG: hypothetical protein J6V98_03775 [Bacteroidales bacterium]|nr:hypothetical protein [Bacteroidales bacterium]